MFKKKQPLRIGGPVCILEYFWMRCAIAGNPLQFSTRITSIIGQDKAEYANDFRLGLPSGLRAAPSTVKASLWMTRCLDRNREFKLSRGHMRHFPCEVYKYFPTNGMLARNAQERSSRGLLQAPSTKKRRICTSPLGLSSRTKDRGHLRGK